TKMSPEPTTRTCRPSRWTAVISEAIELPRHHIRDDLQQVGVLAEQALDQARSPSGDDRLARAAAAHLSNALDKRGASRSGRANDDKNSYDGRGSGIRSRTRTIRVVGRLQIGFDQRIGCKTRPR